MAKSPFVIEFLHDQRPGKVDHSERSPGPDGAAYNRAGYTSSLVKPELEMTWVPGRSTLEAYVEVALIRFRLKDFVVKISSDYAAESCAYKATLEHEMTAHVDDPVRLFHSFKTLMEGYAEDIVLPTKRTPLRAKSLSDLAVRQEAAAEPVQTAIREVKEMLVARLRLASARHDSAKEYKLVYGQCKAADWGAGK